MEAYRKWLDSLPLWLKIVLALPGIDSIFYGLYRLCKGTLPGIILGIVWILAGWAILWIADILLLVLKGKVFEL